MGPDLPPREPDVEHDVVWLVRLRWALIVGKVAVIAGGATLLGLSLPLGALAGLVGLEAASNTWLTLRGRPVGGGPAPAGQPQAGPGLLVGVLAFDVAALTVALALTGGPANPFSALYLVMVALSPVILPPRLAWAVAALAVGAFGSLFAWHRPLTPRPHHVGTPGMGEHLAGMWLAFAVTAGLVVHFVHRVTRALARRDAQLAEARERAARHARLASLATLAGGAAHELNTPLSTIAVAAAELARSAALAGRPEEEDARLIRSQVDRCRDILERMAGDAGDAWGTGGEAPVPVGLADVARDAVRESQAEARVEVALDPAAAGATVLAPRRVLGRALQGVLSNALDASPPDGRVRLSVGPARAEPAWRVRVEDEGEGMDSDVLARAGEPFFTTKAPGAGMGLGLFLARAVVEQLGGRLEIDSRPGEGTRVDVLLPEAQAARP